MKNIQTTGSTYRTSDYSLFSRLEGNRAVLASRVSKILKSINESGYIFNPIVVNESYQIIDGQGRFEALKSMNLPIDFVIAPGAGLEECVALNSSTTSWSISDYINSHCELGNANYLRLRDIISKFPHLTLRIIAPIVMGVSALNSRDIKSGSITISEEQVESATADLQLISTVFPTLKRTQGGPGYYPYAIAFARHCGASVDRLILTLSRADLGPGVSIRAALDNLSDVYNWALRDRFKRIYLYTLYEQSCANKFGWYNKNWASPISSVPDPDNGSGIGDRRNDD